MCVHLKQFAGACVGVGSHQEHLNLRETWQRCDLGQRQECEVVRTLTIASINREEVIG